MICITYNNGRVLRGVVLAFGDRRVRVAVKDSDDAVEFRLVNQVWISEDCEVVRLEFAGSPAPAPHDEADLQETFLCSQLQRVSLQRVM